MHKLYLRSARIWCAKFGALWKRKGRMYNLSLLLAYIVTQPDMQPDRPTDLPRAARRSKVWVGSTDRPTLFGPAGAQCASRPARPTDPLCAAGGAKYDSDHPTDRPSLRLAGDAERLINFAPPVRRERNRWEFHSGHWRATGHAWPTNS